MTVLIAGAGPVGLAAANVLADAGVAVTVLEAEPRLPENLRASTFQPPTLDLLARFGATARLIEMGRVARKVQYRDRTGWIAELDFGVLEGDTQHPYRVQCEQYRLNQVLAARLKNVHFGATVTALDQDANGVTVTVNGGEKHHGDWLIGDYMTEGVFPTLLHQDPRYFRRSTGSGWSRLGYAMGQIFWTHRDSGGTQFNFSEVLGNSSSVAISNAHYKDNRSASNAVSSLGVQLGVDMAANVLKEFWPDLERKFRRKHRR